MKWQTAANNPSISCSFLFSTDFFFLYKRKIKGKSNSKINKDLSIVYMFLLLATN